MMLKNQILGGKKMKKRLLATVLALNMVLGMLTGTAWAAEPTSGTCGENVTWSLSGGTLTISGSGPMANYDIVSCIYPPWWDYRKLNYREDPITSVVIDNGITSIGDWALLECSGLTSITIPDGVTSIGKGAFASSGLTCITIPGSVTSIGSEAFNRCIGLTSITIPDGVTTIGGWTFQGCSSLTSITIPDGVTSIEYEAFRGCSGLTSITIPASVTSIGQSAFEHCNSLADVYYTGTEAQWESIKIYSDNILLTSATIHYNSTGPDQPTPPDEPATSGECGPSATWAFENGVLTISGGDFMYDFRLDTVPEDLPPWYDFREQIEKIVINEGISIVGKNAFNRCNNLTTANLPQSIFAVNEAAFAGCDSLTDSYYNNSKEEWETKVQVGSSNEPLVQSLHFVMSGTCGDNLTWKIENGVLTISGTGDMEDFGAGPDGKWVSDKPTPWEPYNKDITTVVVEDGVEGIGSYAFTNLSACKSITLGAGIDSVRKGSIDGHGAKVTFTGDAPSFLYTDFGTSHTTELYYDDTRDIPHWRFIVNRNYGNGDTLSNVFWIPIQNKPRELPVRQTFSFTNYDPYFVRERKNTPWADENKYMTEDGYYITSKDYNKLIRAVLFNANDRQNLMKETEQNENVKAFNKNGKDDAGKVANWRGSCYGMSAIVAAVINGAISPSELGITSNDLHSVGNSNQQLLPESIRSLVNFYHFQQKLKDVNDQKANFRNMNQKDQITALRQLVEVAEKENRVVLIEYDMLSSTVGKVGHTVVGYAVQYGRFSLTVNDISRVYNGRIMVYDPNYPGDSQSDTCAIYFNDTTFAIPEHNIVSFKQGIDKDTGDTGTLTGLLSIDNYINAVDYKTGKLSYTPASRSASTLAYLSTGNQDLDLTINSRTEAIRDGLFGGTRTISDSGAMILFPSDGENGGASYTVVLPVEGEYRVDATEKFSCSVQTDNLYMDAASPSAAGICFNSTGKVELVSNAPTTASLSLTANDGYHVLPWHTIETTSGDAKELSLELTDDGVIVAGDNLINTTITGIQGDEEEETVSISTDEDSVLITEKDEKFEILIDADNDGEYETPIETTPVLPTPTGYTVTFNANGGTVTPATMDTNEIGKLTSLPTPARTGYSFDGWYTEPSGGTRITTDTVFTESTTVYAHWTYTGGDSGGVTGDNSSSGGSSPSGSNSSSNTISIPIVAGGKISVNPKTAVKGTTVTITVTPDSGYELDGITVKDSKGNTLELTDKGGGKYTFKMPDCAITVSAAFKQIDNSSTTTTVSDWSNPFTDVAASAWYYDAVKFACEGGLMNGISSIQFAPDANLSRAQLAQILYNKEGKPAVSGSSIFTDVTASAWYSDAVIWAAANNIVGGYGNGQFGPDDNITREQLAAMLWRYSGSPAATNKELRFNDAGQISGYALDALRWAVENGIINGYGNGQLAPQGLATRAQVAQMLKNYLER